MQVFIHVTNSDPTLSKSVKGTNLRQDKLQHVKGTTGGNCNPSTSRPDGHSAAGVVAGSDIPTGIAGAVADRCTDIGVIMYRIHCGHITDENSYMSQQT